MIYTSPGIYLDYDNMSKNLGISKKTLVKHIFYLEFFYLIRKIKNFRPSVFAITRKMQKIYPYRWSLAYIYNDNFDKIIENVIASVLDLRNYWRAGGKEIDFLVIKDKKIIPIEIKNKTEINNNELKNMIYFFKKYNYKKGMIIYNGIEKSINIKKIKIEFIPLWKFLLRKDYTAK